MVERSRWQYCQLEVGVDSQGVLKQFFPDRPPIEHNLRDNWPAMLGKLGEQGWEVVNAFPNEGGRGRSPLTYVFKRSASVALNMGSTVPDPQVQQSTDWQQQSSQQAQDEPPDDDEPFSGFEPLRGV
ncbi:MAG: hypothetical protein ACFB51_14275 [Anaerolineae bacterium]